MEDGGRMERKRKSARNSAQVGTPSVPHPSSIRCTSVCLIPLSNHCLYRKARKHGLKRVDDADVLRFREMGMLSWTVVGWYADEGMTIRMYVVPSFFKQF